MSSFNKIVSGNPFNDAATIVNPTYKDIRYKFKETENFVDPLTKLFKDGTASFTTTIRDCYKDLIKAKSDRKEYGVADPDEEAFKKHEDTYTKRLYHGRELCQLCISATKEYYKTPWGKVEKFFQKALNILFGFETSINIAERVRNEIDMELYERTKHLYDLHEKPSIGQLGEDVSIVQLDEDVFVQLDEDVDLNDETIELLNKKLEQLKKEARWDSALKMLKNFSDTPITIDNVVLISDENQNIYTLDKTEINEGICRVKWYAPNQEEPTEVLIINDGSRTVSTPAIPKRIEEVLGSLIGTEDSAEDVEESLEDFGLESDDDYASEIDEQIDPALSLMDPQFEYSPDSDSLGPDLADEVQIGVDLDEKVQGPSGKLEFFDQYNDEHLTVAKGSSWMTRQL